MTNTESKNNMTNMSDIRTDNNSEADNTELNNVKYTETHSEFNRVAMESLGKQVRLTDEEENSGLELYCYVRCGPKDSSLLHQCRGVVFNKDKLVMKAFPYTIEYTQFDVEKIKEEIDISSCKFYDSHEGSLIRMFYYDNKWYTSTHRKLNAFNSKWGSKESFGTAFKKALEQEVSTNTNLSTAMAAYEGNILERFQSTLDTSKQYMFLVRHSSEHRIVCNAPQNPTLYHVGSFVNGELVLTDNCNIPQPKEHKFDSVDEILQYVTETNIYELQGIICFCSDNKQLKIMNNEYQELFFARGNEPSIKFRYLQVRMNQRMHTMLCKLYPNMLTVFDEIENNIYSIAKNIYQSYVQRFIKKRFVTVPVEEFAVIKECHKWHELDRVQNRISINKIIEVLNAQRPTNINRMIKRYTNEKIDKIKLQKNQNRVITSNKVSPLHLGTNNVKNVPQMNLV